MFKLLCVLLPVVARVALAAPATISERCNDPETHGLPFTGPVSVIPTADLPFDPEPVDLEPIDLGPIGFGPIDLEPIDLEPIDLEPFGPETQVVSASPSLLAEPAHVPIDSESPVLSSSPTSPTRHATIPSLGSKPWPQGLNGTGIDAGRGSRKGVSSSSKKKNVVYFANWSIYGAGFLPQNIPAEDITHLLYAFAGIAADGSVISIDPWGDEQKLLGNQAGGDSQGNVVHGAIEQVFLLKQKHRHMKTLLSIGGWTASQEGKFAPAISSADGRRRFAETAVKLLADWGFDGLDIDYEYPATEQDAEDFVLLLKECREALDEYASSNGQRYHYLLTVATAAGPSHYNLLDLEGMDEYIDTWHLMAYDYAGSWDNTSGDQANVYPDWDNPGSTKFNTDEAVDDYLARGIDPGKIILGLPLYGRSFMNTDGLGQPYSGVGQGSIEQGVWLYRDLPRPGSIVHVDRDVIAAYSYDPATRELVSYDNVETARLKAEYLYNRDLGGAVFWEASGDHAGEESLIRTMAREMGDLDDSRNMMDYPQSKFSNIQDASW